MNDYRIHADQLEQHHIARKTFLQLGIGHGIAAIFYYDSFIEKPLDVWQRLRQCMSFLDGGGRGK